MHPGAATPVRAGAPVARAPAAVAAARLAWVAEMASVYVHIQKPRKTKRKESAAVAVKRGKWAARVRSDGRDIWRGGIHTAEAAQYWANDFETVAPALPSADALMRMSFAEALEH